MILSKDSNNNWTPTAGGNGTFIGTLAAFNAIKDTLPVNTVAYITDDGNGDLQPVDAVTNGDMHPVTSNAVYDALNTVSSVTGIRNDTYVNSTNFICQGSKIGHIVTIVFQFQIKVNLLSTEEIISGLPKPVESITFSMCTTDHTSNNSWVLQSNGALRSHYSAPQDEWAIGSLTYLTND